MEKNIKTPLRYPGGKSRVAEMLVENMPSFSEYREPFIGGGSVFIKAKSKNPDAKFWINDLYYDLYCFWNSSANNNDEVIAIIRGLKDNFDDGKELYKYLCDNIASMDDTAKAAAFFILNRITFSGTTLSGGYSNAAYEKRFTESSINRLSNLSGFLKDVMITNYDYSGLLTKEGDDVFIFMDPPYYSATKSALYGKNGSLHTGFDHERFKKYVSLCNHKWMITYDDCGYIRNLYKDYNIKPFELMYGMKNVGKNSEMKGKEIIITNY